MIILQPFLNDAIYNNFISLSLGMRILCTNEVCLLYNDMTNKLLLEFVKDFPHIYGENKLSFNIHAILHLANEVKTFGCSLNGFSCFPFENYLKTIRGMIKNSRKPLQQLVNRLHEDKGLRRPQKQDTYPAPLFNSNNEIIKVNLEHFIISNDLPNNCGLTYTNKILIIKDIICKKIIFVCHQMLECTPLFTRPIFC